jgi:hypothetical protein
MALFRVTAGKLAEGQVSVSRPDLVILCYHRRFTYRRLRNLQLRLAKRTIHFKMWAALLHYDRRK